MSHVFGLVEYLNVVIRLKLLIFLKILYLLLYIFVNFVLVMTTSKQFSQLCSEENLLIYQRIEILLRI